MKKMMIVVFAGLLFVGLAFHRSYAEPCGCGEMGMHEGPQMKHHGWGLSHGSMGARQFMWKKLMGLGLSDQQMDALRAIKTRVAKDTIKKRADLELARVELKELLHKDEVDMKAVEASLKKVESVRTELKLSHIKAREEIKAILTPEQRKKYKEEIKASFLMNHKGMCGGRHGSTPPVSKDETRQGAEAK